jgi:hypothetical protein
LAQSNLFLISSSGAANLSFNEFNPIFNRNGATIQPSFLAGNNDTYGGELVASGIINKLSWSFGASKFSTDGFRENNDQDNDLVNAFVQYELNYRTSIQFEYRYSDDERGDVQLRFFEDDFSEFLTQKDQIDQYRLGFRHSFSPGSDLIGNFQYSDGERDATDGFPDPDFFFPIFVVDVDSDDDGYGGELQYLRRSQYLNFVGGGGYYHIDRKDDVTLALDFGVPPLFPLDESTDNLDVNHYNAYVYSYLNFLKNMTLTLGASYDDYDPDDEDLLKDRSQFNPKAGITWNPFKSTTLRGAAFRVLKRTLLSDQTVEPTQVAGFNQFFDELNATDYWVFGGALDQKVTDSIYGGVEYTYRDLNVPFIQVDPVTFASSVENSNWDEKIFRAYLFWTPHEWLALRAEYLWERLERDTDNPEGAETAETNFLPVGINFFHPSGLSAGLTGTWVKQQGRFERVDTGTFENGDDDFFLLDASANYRLPKRYGFFTVGIKNLTDEDFEFFDSDRDNPRIQPDRFYFVSVTLAIP